MTDNEIIKALECHSIPSCGRCPLYDTSECSCELSTYTLDLIKRQQAEIERLKETTNPYKLHYGNLRMEVAREFADRLYDRAFRTTINNGGIECYTKVVASTEIYDLLEEMENEQ